MTRSAIPSRDEVLIALAQLQAEAERTGRQLAVLALARRLGLANTTFRRNFPDIASELAHQAAAGRQQATPAPGGYQQLQESGARLRQENRRLREELELAAAVIQRITVENQRLREQLETAAKVTTIASKTARSLRPAHDTAEDR
jgi:hypothetical protein